mmetsp:Transcript_3423/g.8648  ORF Transcript_3423/g.8648 Transcript_3423/m.8648 type:complete len:216 (+) Transcript_3423:522-1169(+)
MQHVTLLIAVLRQYQKDNHVTERFLPTSSIGLHNRGVVDGVVALRQLEVLIVVEVESVQQGVEAQLDLLEVFTLEMLGVDLLAKNRRSDPLLAVKAEPNLLQDEVHLLLALHGAVRLDLHLLQHLGSPGNVALVFLDLRKNPGQTSPLQLSVDLALRHGAEGVDQGELVFHVRRLIEVLHAFLHYLRHHLLELPSALHKNRNTVVQGGPVVCLPA